ncbi:unnamed protein product, partial [Candidula unifasciata]
MATIQRRRHFGLASSLGDHVCCRCLLLILAVLLNVTCSVLSDTPQWLDPLASHGKRIHLRNIDLSSSPIEENEKSDYSTSDLVEDEGYLTDTRQEAVNPGNIGGVVIQQASQDLSARLRWLSNDEIGITNMQ